MKRDRNREDANGTAKRMDRGGAKHPEKGHTLDMGEWWGKDWGRKEASELVVQCVRERDGGGGKRGKGWGRLVN